MFLYKNNYTIKQLNNQFRANSDNLVIEVALMLVTVSVYGTEQAPTPATYC